ncbi:unnamed protein product [Brassicogethes aeneus]|uniref:TRASH domain-containing protein n=1 Tax=Brassicogethes aeneus TaxID=1431903 RepID=A0A9P0FMT4_BRAAE|nr:unnamed protein product [Brassicogethes aeneus]
METEIKSQPEDHLPKNEVLANTDANKLQELQNSLTEFIDGTDTNEIIAEAKTPLREESTTPNDKDDISLKNDETEDPKGKTIDTNNIEDSRPINDINFPTKDPESINNEEATPMEVDSEDKKMDTDLVEESDDEPVKTSEKDCIEVNLDDNTNIDHEDSEKVKSDTVELNDKDPESSIKDVDTSLNKEECHKTLDVTQESPKVDENKEEMEEKEETSEKEQEDEVVSEKEKEPEKEKNDEPSDKDEKDAKETTEELDNSTIEDNHRESVFVHVDPETEEKDGEDTDKDSEENKLIEEDPIGSDAFDSLNEDREGADAELCIIPDSERVITQEEKDAAATIPPLKDIATAAETTETSTETPAAAVIDVVISKFEGEDTHQCSECTLQKKVKFKYTKDSNVEYLCDTNCLEQFKSKNPTATTDWEEATLRVKDFTSNKEEVMSVGKSRLCASCSKETLDIENNLTWEIMDFCNEFCLSKYQKEHGSQCATCKINVKPNSLGKYCVRFGNDIRQFCTSTCLEEYKKGLKVCSYCQQEMSGDVEGFLAPVGDKGQFKDFCSQTCLDKYDIMTNDRPPKVDAGTKCSVCQKDNPIKIEFELDKSKNFFCSDVCFVAFSFVNNVSSGKCAMCKRYFGKKLLEENAMFYDNLQFSFCSNSCKNIYIIAHRKIVPCSWCKVKKYNFDMIRRYSKTNPQINMCSVNCLSLYQVSMNAVTAKKTSCNFCQKVLAALYHLTMSDATIRNFCSYNCVMSFQNQFPKQPITLNRLNDTGFPVPTGAPKKNKRYEKENSPEVQLPVITNVQSLATNGTLSPNPPALQPLTRSTRSKGTTFNSVDSVDDSLQHQIRQHFIFKPAPVPEQRNMATMCKVRNTNKGVQAKATMVNKEIQTDTWEQQKIIIPIPVPIYVPTPMHMFTAPVPMPVPFPLPIPVPIFIPTSRNSAAGIMKEIKKIQVKMPTDPYEAELLMMAEMVAEEKKEDPTDSESDVDDNTGGDDGTFSPEPVDASNTFGDDMLQMALKMATELEEPAVDLEGALTANTITAPQGHHSATPHAIGAEQAHEESVDESQPMHPHQMMERAALRGRKRGMRQPKPSGAKRGRRMSQNVDMPMMQTQAQSQAPPPPEPAEKPDANMCLKYTFGVNAWKQWVTTKNTELEKSSRRVKLFKTEILQLTADELNYSLCLFVKEVRKPNGAEYAPDTIYYLCLGIQQYLFENGRIDNIFCDPYYEKFTDCLDEVAKKFSVLYNDSHYIVTRVEEEHLWESKQLGAHSPHVLLSTLMFFNTKHFNLTTVDEHMQLSFSHIMKHWKRNPNQPGASKVPGSRNVLLRFYPPQSAIQNNARKKKVYEQQENEENPLRCPVKLYEFYLSKCPESVKTRNDVFYLQPERSCVPDSPVWYSTMPLPREALEKMLHRVKMVKEINVALLTS